MALGPALDVLVLGDHPSAYLAACLLRGEGRLSVAHVRQTALSDDRLVLINPAFFSLHKMLGPLRQRMALHPLARVRFLGEQPQTRSEVQLGKAMPASASLIGVRDAMRRMAEDAGVVLLDDERLIIQRADEAGVEVLVHGRPTRTRVMVLADLPPPSQRAVLDLPRGWDPGVLHRQTWLLFRDRASEVDDSHTLTMALDLEDSDCWGWLIRWRGQTQLGVHQPVERLPRLAPLALLERWIQRLARHGAIKSADQLPPVVRASQMDVALAGALSQESVANRALLIGPAGGFHSASGEEIHPTCWSAVYAADVLRKAMKEKHLQDALQPFRQRWGSTLGDYLRGPQQNLRFLMPLVYRNSTMATRLAESILLGKSVIH
jgi:hypothetical protein